MKPLGTGDIINLSAAYTGVKASFSNYLPQGFDTKGVLQRHHLGEETRGGESDWLRAWPDYRYSVLTNPGRELGDLVSPIHGVLGIMQHREYDADYEGPAPANIIPLGPSIASEVDRQQGIERFAIQDPTRPGEQGINILSVILASARGFAAPGSNSLFIELKGSLVAKPPLQKAIAPVDTFRLGDRNSYLAKRGVVWTPHKKI